MTAKKAEQMRQKFLPWLLLILILAYGAALRFSGQNWDDFSHIHPDERFLTALLLPQIGGGNTFTADQLNYPKQDVLAARDNTNSRDWNTLAANPLTRIGVVRDTFALEVAGWLANDQQITIFGSDRAAESALLAEAVDLVLVAGSRAATYADSVAPIHSLRSEDLQGLHCKHRYPASDGIGDYFDTRCSPLNPHNAGHGFYVYGTFPLFLTHFASEFVRDATNAGLPLFDFQSGHLVWRGISALFDLLAIFAVFALGRRIHGNWVGVLAALFYTAAPLAIQKAHFGTVNALASFLVTVALYLAVSAQQRGNYRYYLLFGLCTGAAVASRINLAPLAGIIIIAAGMRAVPVFDAALHPRERARILSRNILGLLLAGLGAFLAFRILNPYAFAGPGFFGLLPNHRWLENLRSISAGVSGAQDFPPNWQWLARSSLVYTQKDMLLWAMGLSFGVLGWFGWLWSAFRILRFRATAAGDGLILVIWIGGYYLFMSRLAAQTMRYYLPLYSSLAVLAGWCLCEWYRRENSHERGLRNIVIPMLAIGALLSAVGVYQVANVAPDATGITALGLGLALIASAVIPRLNRWRPAILCIFAVAFSLCWGLMFSNIYRRQTTLVQSAHYIFERVPGDFAMAIEGADDTVPLVNIAFHNTNYASSTLEGSPFDSVNIYAEGERMEATFRAPASGRINSVFAPHLADPHDDPELEEISIQVMNDQGDQILATATLQANLARQQHPLGAGYSIDFDQPLDIVEGLHYTFAVQVAAGSGDVIGSGSVVLHEGSWDNQATGIITCRLPEGVFLADDPPPGLVNSRDCRGRYPFSAVINSQSQIMSFPLDNQIKYDDIVRTLDIGDYLTIASNRFYDTQPRNQMRWPLTTLYYEKLFAGELGYKLEAVFEETFELGPWRVADQHLPVHDSPTWLNELEADEAFHVYDHPTVFIFRKTDDYSRAKVEAILSEVSLRQAHELQRDDSEAQLLGVLFWNLTEAEPVPTGLTFTPSQRQIQQDGGTWSERFFSDSIVNTNQVAGVVIWYATIFVIGALAFPLVFAILPTMADGGYGVSKLVGMLIVAWFAWAVSSLKIPIWSQGGILFSLCLLAIVSAFHCRIRFVEFLRDNWKRLAWIELLSVAAFLALIVVRLTNPDLWHPGKGGEKPMDFAYLNGVLRSTTFPPIDPWFSGGFINYYYFGYVLVGAPTLLLGVVPALAYNFMIPTVFSLTGLGAFSVAFNVTSRWRHSIVPQRSTKGSRGRLGNPWVAGVTALLLCISMGNLDTVRVVGNEIAALGGYSKPEGLEQFLISDYETSHNATASADTRAELSRRAAELHPWDSIRYEADSSLSLLGGLMRGAGKILQGELPHINSDRWYWGPSRVLAETPGVRGNAITEMPYFTFLYGDLHAHMINMPLILLTLLLLFNEVIQSGNYYRPPRERILALLLLSLTVGVMTATNTWDWPSMSLLALVALTYAWTMRWKSSFRPLRDTRFTAGFLTVLIVSVSILTFLLSGRPAQLQPINTTVLAVANVLQAALLLCIAALILWLALRRLFVRASALEFVATIGGFCALNLAFALPYTSWHATTYNSIHLWQGGKTPLWAYFDIHGLFLFLILSLLAWDTGRWFRHTPVQALIIHRKLATRTLVAIALASLLAALLALAGYQVALVVLPLVCWIALLFFRTGQSEAMRFTLVLIGMALSITLGVEILVLGGDIGRQNTVFKFYIQVWLLLSVAGGIAFACLLAASNHFSPRLRSLWYIPCVLLFGIAGLFPITATRGRSLDRMAPKLPLTLNGMDYMLQAKHHEYSPVSQAGRINDIAVDYQLIRWLQENVAGSPVIIEGRQPGGEYRWNGRVSNMTGLPSVLGWNWHQRQQRTIQPMNDWVTQRERNILQFYNTADIDIALDIIHHFDISYIIRSGLEEVHSTAEGLEKFERMVEAGLLTVAFEVPGGKIYEVDEGALMLRLLERGA